MGEKYYRPIIKDGDHLLRSKDNPGRVRGLTRDKNNQNPDIVEWEEYDPDNNMRDNCDDRMEKEKGVELTPEQQEIVQMLAEGLAIFLVEGGARIVKNYLSPWWKGTAWPWIKEKGRDISTSVTERRKKKDRTPKEETQTEYAQGAQLIDISTQIDESFERVYYNMTEEEVSECLMDIVNHMLCIAEDIHKISNARLRKSCETDLQYFEEKKNMESFLSEKTADGLNRLLSNERLMVDLETTKKLFELTGGGVRLNGEYAPVQAKRIEEVLKSIVTEDE